MISVDAFDLKILSALQDDGRLTNQQLAEIAGLSASQCSRRRMRLEQDKVIAGYHADLAADVLGFQVIAFIHITLATHSPDNAERFRALVDRVADFVAGLHHAVEAVFGAEEGDELEVGGAPQYLNRGYAEPIDTGRMGE